jgi:hypothetical protein
MKKILLSTLMVFAIALTACSSSTNSQNSLIQTDGGVSTGIQLALGSLKLEDTEYAITNEQATELLPMWQVYSELLSSDTAAQEEINALIEQIQEAMTSEQMQAITNMQLTQQDMLTALQGANTLTSNSQSNNNVTVLSGNGGMPAGGPLDDGGGVPPDLAGGISPDFGGTSTQSDISVGQTQNAQTGSGQVRSASVPTLLIQMLIESLQQKVTV